jgi:hypothetical protein
MHSARIMIQAVEPPWKRRCDVSFMHTQYTVDDWEMMGRGCLIKEVMLAILSPAPVTVGGRSFLSPGRDALFVHLVHVRRG